MKRILAILISCSLLLTGCRVAGNENEIVSDIQGYEVADSKDNNYSEQVSFASLSEPELLTYVEEAVYTELVTTLDSDKYFVENIEAVYVSKEYLEEVAYNSQANIYFGFTLAELNELFQGERYVFTLGEDGATTVEAFVEYDDTYDRALKKYCTRNRSYSCMCYGFCSDRRNCSSG